jgi:hypothetical protein
MMLSFRSQAGILCQDTTSNEIQEEDSSYLILRI